MAILHIFPAERHAFSSTGSPDLNLGDQLAGLFELFAWGDGEMVTVFGG